MSEMNQFLAEYYGTAGQATTGDDETKLAEAAQMELFAKMAAAQGIDLESMSDADVEQLYLQTFSKEASEEEEEKKAEAEKVAEADFLGRVMAHAYVNELNKIAAAQETKEAKAGDFGKALKGFGKSVDKKVTKAVGAVKGKAEELSSSAKKTYRKAEKAVSEKADAAHRYAKKNPGKTLAAGMAAGGAAGAAGGYAAGRKEASGSALEELAYEAAVEKAAAAGWDADEVVTRLAALQILGATDENSKIAAAGNLEEAVDIRAAELLELAGYPVTWQ